MTHDLHTVRISTSNQTTSTSTSTSSQPPPSPPQQQQHWQEQSSVTTDLPPTSITSENDMSLSTGKRRTFASNIMNSSDSTNTNGNNTNSTSTSTKNVNNNTNNNSNSNNNNLSNSTKSSSHHIHISSEISLKPSISSTNSSSDDPVRTASVSRRRRFILYTLAFATMLAMSSVLDVRRAALRNRHAKLQLSLPTASLSTLSDDLVETTAITNLDSDQTQQQNEDDTDSNEDVDIPQLPQQAPVSADRVSQSSSTSATAGADSEKSDASTSTTKHEYKISQQELDDGVDQLIAHVDQEENAAITASLNNSTLTDEEDKQSTSLDSNQTSDQQKSSSDDSSSNLSSVPIPKDSKTTSSEPSSSSISTTTIVPSGSDLNSTLGNEDVKLNAEDTFHAAIQRLAEILKEDKSKTNIDENDLRTLQALELQATRGDCELKSGASLFKTDAEAASSMDIERTHPLWGAWCLFMGSYKSDAMRDYVTKELVVEQKFNNFKNLSLSENHNESSTSFDSNAASLDDVMKTDQQAVLRKQAELVIDHLQENDLRHLAALSLQATFGDCGPYGKEMTIPSLTSVSSSKESTLDSANLANLVNEKDLRKLREPLFEQTATRKKGALWGAWCVMQGKKRSAAATNLSQRVESLVDQLTRSQEAADAEEEGRNSELEADSAHSSDATEKLDTSARTIRYPDEEEA